VNEARKPTDDELVGIYEVTTYTEDGVLFPTKQRHTCKWYYDLNGSLRFTWSAWEQEDGRCGDETIGEELLGDCEAKVVKSVGLLHGEVFERLFLFRKLGTGLWHVRTRLPVYSDYRDEAGKFELKGYELHKKLD